MSSRRLRNSNLPGDHRGLAELTAAAFVMLGRAWPDTLTVTIIIARAAGSPSSVRRALALLEAEGHVERRGRCWRAVRPSAPVSAPPRLGRPSRHLGFRAVWIERRAAERAR